MQTQTIDSSEQLGRLIRKRRLELGMTQTAVADVARTTLRLVSELEGGKRTAQLDGVMRILTALGIVLEARWR